MNCRPTMQVLLVTWPTTQLKMYIPLHSNKKMSIPKYQFMFSKLVIVVDHLKHQLIIINNVINPSQGDYDSAIKSIDHIYNHLQTNHFTQSIKHPENEPLCFESNFEKKDYIDSVEKAKEYIVAGDIFQVVLSQKFTAKGNINGFDLYRNLRKENPAPYLSYIRFLDLKSYVRLQKCS